MSNDPTKDPNITFRGRLGNHPVVKILVSGRASASKSFEESEAGLKAQPKDGPVLRRRPEDELIRKKKNQLINFYDMGQIRNGSGWDDTTFQISSAPVEGPLFLTPQIVTTSDYDNRDIPLLAISTADYLTTFRKITKGTLADKYGTGVNFGVYSDALENLSQWSNKGLKVEQADLNTGLSVLGDKFFSDFVLLAGTNIKVTSTPLYSDPSVSFTPSPRMDIFLTPSIGVMGFSARTSTFGNREWFGALALTFPRHFRINSNDPWSGGVSLTSDGAPLPSAPGGFDTQCLAAIAAWKALVSGREYHYDYVSHTWGGGAYPPPAPREGGGGYATESESVVPVNGHLYAVVKQGSNFFYFWGTGY